MSKASDQLYVPEWRVCFCFPAYEVSDSGGVRNAVTGKELSPHVGNHGYKRLTVSSRPNKNVLLHRLVAEAFIPNPERSPFINHKDSNRSNNDIRNLEWCSVTGNALHAANAGSLAKKLTPQQIREIRACGGTDTSTAHAFGVSQVMVTRIRAGKAWRHVS